MNRRTEFLRTAVLSILGGAAGGEAMEKSSSFEFVLIVV
jgi:hypothetical protein